MARTRWSIRNYNAFLREAKAELGITHAEAQALYADMRVDVGRPLYGVDFHKQHTAHDIDTSAELVEDYGLDPWFDAREYYEAVEMPEDWLAEGTELELYAETEGGVYEE